MGTVVENVLGGPDTDETILDYVKAVLEDELFDWGEAGEGAYEALGPILVCSIMIIFRLGSSMSESLR